MHYRMTKWLGLAVVASALVAGPALGAAPKTSLLEGMMTSSGGGAAADGLYDVTFSLWGAQSGGAEVWSEGPVKVAVKGGQFSYALGSTKALDMKKVAALSSQWIGIKIGSDPALPRQRVHGALFALYATNAGALTCTGCLSANHIANGSVSAAKMGFNYAGSATKGGPASDLKCTGCVSVSEMKFDADVNLGANSLKAKNGTFSGDLAAGTVTATSYAGDGSKLTGIKIPTGECKTAGEVVKGINADGSLKCVKAMDPNALPADGLNEISNNMLTNQFVYTESAKVKKQPIPDNTGSTADSIIAFPNIGTAQTLDVKVTVENSNLAAVSMQLLPPDDKKVGYVLCDPCGKKDQRKLVATYNAKNPPQKQAGAGKKIGDWVGGNPQGAWTLKVLDVAFCVVQIAENKPLCPIGKGVDGWISDWSINMQYISNQKVGVNGNLIVSGSLTFGGQGAINGDVHFKKNTRVDGFADQRNGWCPTQPNGERSTVAGGVCTPAVGSWRNWPNAISFCKAKGADLCSSAQVWVLRKQGMFGDQHDDAGVYRVHPNSYGDNDASNWNGVFGNFSDDTSAGTSGYAPCCYNSTPHRDTDKVIKLNSGDKGIRLVSLHNGQDASFYTAAATCAAQNADICTKSELVYLRSAGVVKGTRMWGNDGQDNDGDKEYGSGPMANDVHPYYAYGFACCAGEITSSTKCPEGGTYTNGVCWAKVVNSNSSLWVDAAKDCGKLGTSVCTISQSAVLRIAGVLKPSGNWSAGMGDCDGQCGGNYGLGSVSNDINNNGTNKYGYACCF
ncbi:MAG: hypothetical protein KC502_17985 [Myxococcales bacterium]|nr:hypothetical protein [Myxococcales bacterium]